MAFDLGLGKAIVGVANNFLTGRREKNEQKARIQEAKVEATVKRIQQSTDADTNYDLKALEQTQYSWKDEFALLLLSAPFLGAFIPGTQEAVRKGWEYVALAPDWYTISFMGAMAASLGIRWAFKFFGK